MTLPLRLCLLLALALCLGGCGMTQDINNQKIDANLAQAAQEATLGRTAEARQWADRAIALAPNSVSVYAPDPAGSATEAGHGSVGEVFVDAGDNATLVDYMNQAARKFPQSDHPLSLLVQAQKTLGDTANARVNAGKLASLVEAHLARPGVYPSVALLNELAQAYFDAGDTSKGAATYKRVIATYPFNPQADTTRNNLAYAYADANDKPHLAEALTLAQQALKAAQSLSQQGKVPDSDLGVVQDTVGWVQFRQGDYPAALTSLLRAMNNDLRQAENRYHLGMTYEKLGQMDAARAEFDRAVLISPGYADAVAARAALPSVPAPVSSAAA